MLVRNPQAPTGLFDGIAFDGSMAGAYRGSTYFHDSSGLGHHAALTGYATPATGWVWSEELGQWVVDVGPNEDATYVQSDMAVADGIPFAMSCWFLHNGTAQTVLFRGRTTATSNTQELLVTSASRLNGRSGSWTGAFNSLPDVQIGWNHATFSVGADRNTVLSLNGALQTDNLSAFLWSGAQVTALNIVSLGARLTSSPVYSNGRIAAPCIWDRALTPPEIEWLAQPQHKPWVPWERTVWPVAGAAFNPAWAARCNNLIGAGI